MQQFFKELNEIDGDDKVVDFTRKKLLHGIPYVFKDDIDAFYEFRKRIASNFDISFNEIFITGSGHLGFSPHKETYFSHDSDIDVAIVSSSLYENIMEKIRCFQMKKRESRISFTEKELEKYNLFLEYSAIGWMRPDLLPKKFHTGKFRRDWFDYFNSISYGKSEVGDYKVTAGVFKSYFHLEKYTLSGVESIKRRLEVRL
ncbi:hypothetical protein [Photobacterium leiognathi]|uniref:hypothetical protein n=1 Tax=Photobacterium leiognathi TaxID=553611 RepID=UPI0002088E57|nr:hypothetical protein [Photobacterium leiognathi]PSW47862.1 hypothetical protein CTM83_20710 [Photobacterium leiognathi subsp. mandapamensis]GAA06979.1 putative uncharacterized protein [Photobacterium leiognathi subsp. mandapamensis svers.1.1.]